LVRTGAEQGVRLSILEAVESVNERQKSVLVDKVLARFSGDLKGRTFALWGLAFKPNTDDMREAPSRVIVHSLIERGAQVQAYDPVAKHEAQRVFGNLKGLTLADTAAQALQGADALLIATDWKEFKSPDFDLIRSSLKQPVVLDGRNLYEPELMQAMGIHYEGIGRTTAARG
jgi:UDPglucose 6-dehydrogenase